MSKIDNLSSYLLIFSIPIYFLQGAIYETGGMISKLLLMIWLIISVLYLVKTFEQRELNKFSNNIIIFLAINTIYWFFSSKSIGMIETTNDLKNICAVFLSYFPFYYLTKEEALSDTKLKIFALLLLASFAISFFYNQNNLLANLGLYSQNLTNNAAYKFVLILPLFGLFINKKSLFFILYVICLFFIIQGAKRGAIVCFAAQTLLIIFYKFLRNKNNNSINNMIITAIILMLLASITLYYYNSNEYLQGRISGMMSGDDASGDARMYQYTGIIDKSFDGSLVSLMFGYGFDGSVSLVGNYAHNDWLELLADLGLFGVALYMLLFYRLIDYYRRNKEYFDTDLKIMYFSVIATWLLKSMFSMGYISMETFVLVIASAYIHNKIERIKDYSLFVDQQSYD